MGDARTVRAVNALTVGWAGQALRRCSTRGGCTRTSPARTGTRRTS